MSLGSFGLTINGSASDLTVTSAGTVVCTEIASLEGMQALSVWLQLAYGSGGTAVKAYLQTAFDASTWMDIACVAFATVAKTAVLNFSGLTPKLTQLVPTDGAMADDTALDGILGTRMRLKAVVTGTYAGSTILKGRMVAR